MHVTLIANIPQKAELLCIFHTGHNYLFYLCVQPGTLKTHVTPPLLYVLMSCIYYAITKRLIYSYHKRFASNRFDG